jgi:antirestriction protein ArdC
VGHFGTPDYAKEELVAEIGSWLLCSQLGFNNVYAKDNHLAYLKSWLSVLTKDYTELYKAIERGQQACEYLLKEAGLSTSSTTTVTSKALIVRPKGELIVVAA